MTTHPTPRPTEGFPLRFDLLQELAYECRRQFRPDQVIGAPGNVYLKRWHLVRHDGGNVYLHEFHRNDDDRALHDHPWAFSSFVLEGGYWEHSLLYEVTGRPEDQFKRRRVWYGPGEWVRRPWPRWPHRVELPPGQRALTLVVTGPRVREWGFHCPGGWVHWRDFTKPGPDGPSQHTGRGCE